MMMKRRAPETPGKIINRRSTDNTASLVFQTGFSGRAEIGLLGGKNLKVKVSSDGQDFSDALQVNVASGNIGVGRSPATKLDVDGPIRCKSYKVAETPIAAEIGAGAVDFLCRTRREARQLLFPTAPNGGAWRIGQLSHDEAAKK